MQALPLTNPALTPTLESDPGAFGAALATLGFGEGRQVGRTWQFDHATDGVYVVCFQDDSIQLHGVNAQGDSWGSGFEPTTPQVVALGAIAVAVGRLSITQEG